MKNENQQSAEEQRIGMPLRDLEQEAMRGLLSVGQGKERLTEAVAAGLDETCFTAPSRKIIFRAMLDLLAAGRPVNTATIAGVLDDRDLNTCGGHEGLEKIAGIGIVTRQACRRDVLAIINAREKIALHKKQQHISESLAVGDMSADDAAAAHLEAIEAYNATRSKAQAVLGKGADEQRAKEYREQHGAAAAAAGFMARAIERGQRPALSTGLAGLDNLLGGGLQPGLMLIGAISSLGKTTFALQIADTLAAKGQDVLIVSLEQGKDELIAKSVSRITYALEQTATKNEQTATKNEQTATDKKQTDSDSSQYLAMTAGQVLRGETAQDGQQELLTMAMAVYSQGAAPHVYIVTPDARPTPAQVYDMAARHAAMTGKAPVVIVDYLQLLTPAVDGWSDKQAADDAAAALRRIARDYEVPVIAISSINRDSYKAPISMQALKESGGLEYTADYVLGLQYAWAVNGGNAHWVYGSGSKEYDPELYKLARNDEKQRHVELVLLKSRMGKTGSAYATFRPRFNLFQNVAQLPEDLQAK